MNMLFHEFNADRSGAEKVLQKCCGSVNWRAEVMKHYPFPSQQNLIDVVSSAWYNACREADWLEAFLHHPEIGDINSLQEKFSTSRDLAGQEQQGVNDASPKTLQGLLEGNQRYKKKFGFIFIVFASGKSASEMLDLLNARIGNDREDELRLAMGEQQKITMKRLKGHVSDLQTEVSQITTHILDTSSGKPAKGISIGLSIFQDGKAELIAQGITNVDGRISDLLPDGRKLDPGIYRMHFKTEEYFQSLSGATFFPFVDIHFSITDKSHYHIPLLLSPFGFTTYRGS